MKKPTTKEIGDSFENQVYEILKQTDYFDIESYDGGGDRGRDIVIKYEVDGIIKKVHIECKSRQGKVSISNIEDSVNWAKAHDQNLYYIWTDNYFRPNTKDYLVMTSKKYNLNIAYEEKKNVDAFLEAIKKDDKQLFVKLTNKIFKYLKSDCIHESIGSLYSKFKLKLLERVLEYCSENQIECISANDSTLMIKFKNELINISCDLNYRFNSNGAISIFANDTMRCGDIKFPSLILEVVNKTVKLSTLSSLGDLNNEMIESFTSIESLVVKIAGQIIERINRANYDQVYA